MDMIGQVVIHKVFGEGKIVKHTNGYIIALFPQGEKEFPYPGGFQSFLRMKNDNLQTIVLNHLDEVQRKRQAELERVRVSLEEKTRTFMDKNPTNSGIGQVKNNIRIYPRDNIAFKCNFCNGGESSERLGFHGLCSEKMIKYNIKEKKHVWCSSPASFCRQFYDGLSGSYSNLQDAFENDKFFCYESTILQDWKTYAGIYNSGTPMKLKRVQTNSLAALTTRLPGDDEINRIIFAVFLVTDADEGDTHESGFVSAGNSEYKIEMTPREAQKLKFWNYYFCPNAPEVIKFGSGLHRYLSDEQAVQILRDIIDVKRGTAQENIAKEFLDYFVNVNGINLEAIPGKRGALILA